MVRGSGGGKKLREGARRGRKGDDAAATALAPAATKKKGKKRSVLRADEKKRALISREVQKKEAAAHKPGDNVEGFALRGNVPRNGNGKHSEKKGTPSFSLGSMRDGLLQAEDRMGQDQSRMERKDQLRPPKGNSMRSRRAIIASQAEKVKLIVQHSAFRKDPLAALREHLKNTIPGAAHTADIPPTPRKVEATATADTVKAAKSTLMQSVRSSGPAGPARQDGELSMEVDSEAFARAVRTLRTENAFKGERKTRQMLRRKGVAVLQPSIAKRGVIGIPRPKIK
ncbi:hypothetical protein FVE85_8351 [Porphyridium purpureum]|uniref:Ribosome biogenesis protein SLX9 n=1 Tax=Porphyridium purpureum TaxID=35688 RepID=A0A5J4YK99_PORPP|nr:hypothetical protein FVE85_8351 [Porphyridium purpureum]|eukprot:POR2089..scf244_11